MARVTLSVWVDLKVEKFNEDELWQKLSDENHQAKLIKNVTETESCNNNIQPLIDL